MRISYSLLMRGVVTMALFAAVESRATQLTFDVYTNAAKADTDRAANNIVVPPAYGDNVSDFDPATPVSGQYFRYGTNGGLTPHITVEYRFWNNPGDNGGANGRLWNTGYGNLNNALYPTTTASYEEIRFVAATGYRITLSNFDIASFTTTTSGQTLKIVRNAGSASASVLWSAGTDGAVTVNGGAGVHNSYTPNVMVADGATLSLIYGQSGNIAVDNVIFLESIPEPTAAMILCVSGLLLWRRRIQTK